MSQPYQHTEAIILRVIPFQDYHQILTLFTAEVGMMKIIDKGSRDKKKKGLGIALPLTKVEVVYREKRGEIFSCHEMKLVDSFSLLRSKLVYLEVGCDLLQVILRSQFLGKASPQLYALLCFYLARIPQTVDPWILSASFRLKLLKHDGLISFPLVCSECGEPLHRMAHTLGAEPWCENHCPPEGLEWKNEELHVIYQLATCQQYREISSLKMARDLYHKMTSLFEAYLNPHPAHPFNLQRDKAKF